METSNSSVATSTTSSILNDNNKSEVHHPKGVGPLNATACKNCRKEANFMCSACKSVHYCSLDCQVSFENLIQIISFDVDDDSRMTYIAYTGFFQIKDCIFKCCKFFRKKSDAVIQPLLFLKVVFCI